MMCHVMSDSCHVCSVCQLQLVCCQLAIIFPEHQGSVAIWLLMMEGVCVSVCLPVCIDSQYLVKHNVSFIKKKKLADVLAHTHNFPDILVQAMFCSIAIALQHNVSFIKKKDRQMYLHTHAHNFPDILVQAMFCSIAIALQHNVSFIEKEDTEDWQMYIHKHNFSNILVQAKIQEVSLRKTLVSVPQDCK